MKADYKRKATLVHIVFQLTIFVIFMKAKATADMVEGCIESQLTLSCDERKVINISSVVLGDSPCIAIFTSCCPKNDSCTQKPNDNHVTDVHRRCNGQKRCTVNVIKEGISCQTTTSYGNQYNDFERITYDCIDNGKMVEGCTESQLTLSCDERKVINISSVVLGDSWCTGTNCCPKHDSCTAKPNASHVNDVHRRCNGRRWCTVNVFKEGIPCTFIYGLENNDFERIVYDCIDNEKMVEGCIESQLTLSCDERKVINISSVVLGESWCTGTNCCPKHDSCTAKPSDNHVYDVHRRCNGQQKCTVNVTRESISCPYWVVRFNNDFERIVYDCIDNEKIVEGCAFSKMNLTCNEAMVINISSVVLGDSPGCPDANCCPKNNSCTAKPNDSHVNEVLERCNGRLTCTVDVIQERIPCEWTFGYGYHTNDFERITYICIDDRSMLTTKHYTDEIEYTSVTETSISEDAMTSNEPEMLKGTEPMPIIIAIVCPLVLITVIVVIIVLIKRKRKKSQLNANSNPAKFSVVSHDVDDTAYEEIATNGDRTYEKFVSSGTEDFDNHTYMAIATSGDRTYEKFVPSGTEDVDKHTYAGLVTK